MQWKPKSATISYFLILITVFTIQSHSWFGRGNLLDLSFILIFFTFFLVSVPCQNLSDSSVTPTSPPLPLFSEDFQMVHIEFDESFYVVKLKGQIFPKYYIFYPYTCTIHLYSIKCSLKFLLPKVCSRGVFPMKLHLFLLYPWRTSRRKSITFSIFNVYQRYRKRYEREKCQWAK